jgi:hypothetical protein
MGCQSSRENLVSELTSMLNSLTVEIASLKQEKRDVCSQLDKFSYEETMVGKDVIELKAGLEDSINSSITLAQELQNLPNFRDQIVQKKKHYIMKIGIAYEELFNELEKYNKLVLDKHQLIDEKNIETVCISNYEKENDALLKLYSSGVQRISSNEAVNNEVNSLIAQKEQLEEELLNCGKSPFQVMFYPKQRIEEKVARLEESKVLEELVGMQKKNESLEIAIERHKKLRTSDIKQAISVSEKSEQGILEYNRIIRGKKQRIELLTRKLEGLNDEILKLQSVSFGVKRADYNFDLLDKIIEKSKGGVKKPGTADLKKAIRKQELFDTAEETLKKAREMQSFE